MRVVLVDDQTEFRESLRDLLADEQIEIVGEASNGHEAIELVTRLEPDITLMDIRMPVMDGIAATAAIRAKLPGACVLMLTTFDQDRLLRDALRAGASGYLLKGMPPAEMLAVLELTLNGYKTIGPGVGSSDALAKQDSINLEQTEPGSLLSEREVQVWGMIGEGHTNREIALRLFITEGTVKNYVSSILTALSVRHRTEAALLWTSRKRGHSNST
jgi:DNA-binding NarL/FixJ family response regulator